MDRGGAGFKEDRFVLHDEPFPTADEAFAHAHSLIKPGESVDLAPLSIIGDFVLPAADGTPSRDFQTLHFDFGLPLDPRVDQDIARYTALYVPLEASAVSAVTRLVALKPLLQQRPWPAAAGLLERLLAYGHTHGAWDDSLGYLEGSLARIVEAAAGATPQLPSVKVDQQFLCGLEFDSLPAELAFFAGHGLCIEDVALDVPLAPGELLVFDNLALAHGRRDSDRPLSANCATVC